MLFDCLIIWEQEGMNTQSKQPLPTAVISEQKLLVCLFLAILQWVHS